jgi:hypothetical protein
MSKYITDDDGMGARRVVRVHDVEVGCGGFPCFMAYF